MSEYVLRLTDNGRHYYLKPAGVWSAGSVDARTFNTAQSATAHLRLLGLKPDRKNAVIERSSLADALGDRP